MAEGLPGKLELFKADLLTEGAFDPVVQLGSEVPHSFPCFGS